MANREFEEKVEELINDVAQRVDKLDKAMSNADRIRAMSDEELAELLKMYFSCEYNCPARKEGCYENCLSEIKDWLQAESEG